MEGVPRKGPRASPTCRASPWGLAVVSFLQLSGCTPGLSSSPCGF